MTKPTQEQIDEIKKQAYMAHSIIPQFESDNDMIKLTWQKAQDEILDDILFDLHKNEESPFDKMYRLMIKYQELRNRKDVLQ
jgi:hypothetical protein